MRTQTISDLVQVGSVLLQRAGIETALLDSQLLMAHALGSGKVAVIARGTDSVSGEQCARFLSLLEQRAQRVPLAYVTGHWEFYGLDLLVTESVLVPRPETEILVEEALRLLEGREAVVLDVGTGSGAIAVALANSTPSLGVYAVDISPNALKVAEANVSKYGLGDRVTVLLGDMLEPVVGLGCRFDAVVSNPPYIPVGELSCLQPEVSKYEPRVALDGGVDGLEYYRRLFAGVGSLLRDDGFVAVEVGLGQSGKVSSIARGAGFRLTRMVCDLAGIERVVVVTR